jgi:SAM-dependent methyltransferase
MNNDKCNIKKKEGWPYILFVKYPHLYLPELLKMEDLAEAEVNGICEILNGFKIGRGSKILDFSCGIGRHSIRLANKGYEVVGYDPSAFFLKKARERTHAGALKSRIRFYRGEPHRVSQILSRNNETGFKAIIIMFNSLGYASVDEDLIILQNLLTLSSKNGCILITQTENRDWRLKNFEPHIISDFGKYQVLEYWKFNLVDSTSEGFWRFYRKKNRSSSLQLKLDLHYNQRLYSLHELKEVINRSGWKFVKSFGSIEHLQQQVSPDTQEIITVSKN